MIKTMKDLKKQPSGAIGQVLGGLGRHSVIVEVTDDAVKHMTLYWDDGRIPDNTLTIISDDVMCVIENKIAAKTAHLRRWQEIAKKYPEIG